MPRALPDSRHVLALDEGATPGTWRESGRARGKTYKRCANFTLPALCNWLLPAHSPDALCTACNLNRTIPDLSVPDNGPLWFKVEAAKRQMIAQLMTLGLPIRRSEEPDDGGLAFDLLAPGADGAPLLTGHARGLITINILEADDAYRVKVREDMREPYRTLLGHFRHEIGHYYWDQLIAGGPWLEPFRQVFGDEQADYAQALQRNYEQGPPADWDLHFISTYASCHPWEDWAETWAHYLHMMDTLDTAHQLRRHADVGRAVLRTVHHGVAIRPARPRRASLPGSRQRLGSADRGVERAVAQHGATGLLPFRAAGGSGGQASVRASSGEGGVGTGWNARGLTLQSHG